MIMVETRPDALKIDGDFLTFEAKEKHTNEKLLVSYRLKNVSEKDFFSHLSSSMQIKGTFTTQDVEGARNLNGFDYKRYLVLKNISQKVTLENIDQIKKVKFSILHPVRVLQEFRRKQIVYNNERFSPLTADYMNSLLFGYRENSVESFQSTWQSLGVSHLFSLSGMHIYFFLSLFEFLFLNIRLTQEKLFKWSIPFTIILIIMTGCGSGMMRAGIQTITKKVNKQFTIRLTPLDCWSLTLLLNVFIDPFVLLTVGGQLTYYLTFLIVFIYPITEDIKSNVNKGLIFSLLLSWLSLPLIWYHFNEFNVLNFMLNIILTPILFVIILPLLLGTFILSHIVGSLSFFWLDYMLTQFQLVGENLNKWRSFQQVTGKIPVCLLLLVIVVQLSFLKELELRPKVISQKMIFLLILSCLSHSGNF